MMGIFMVTPDFEWGTIWGSTGALADFMPTWPAVVTARWFEKYAILYHSHIPNI